MEEYILERAGELGYICFEEREAGRKLERGKCRILFRRNGCCANLWLGIVGESAHAVLTDAGLDQVLLLGTRCVEVLNLKLNMAARIKPEASNAIFNPVAALARRLHLLYRSSPYKKRKRKRKETLFIIYIYLYLFYVNENLG